MTREQLLLLSNDDIEKQLKHRKVEILTKDDEIITFYVKRLLLAANYPHMFVGFVMDDNSNCYLSDISEINIIEN